MKEKDSLQGIVLVVDCVCLYPIRGAFSQSHSPPKVIQPIGNEQERVSLYVLEVLKAGLDSGMHQLML